MLTIHPGALEQAVVQMHGEFDGAERYLRRFIDMRVPLAPPGAGKFEQSENRCRFMQALYKDAGVTRVLAKEPLALRALVSLAGDRSLSLRDLEQIVHHVGTVCAGLPEPPASAEDQPPSAGTAYRPVDSARWATERWCETVTATVALAILRFTDPATYREATAQHWTSKQDTYEFYLRALSEAGDFSGAPVQWPAEWLADALAKVATRRDADELSFEGDSGVGGTVWRPGSTRERRARRRNVAAPSHPASGRGGALHISEVEPWPGSRDLVSHLVTYTVGEKGVERRAGLVIAPEDATVTAAMIRKAALDTAQSIHNADLAIIVGFEFAPDTGDDKIGRVGVVRVRSTETSKSET